MAEFFFLKNNNDDKEKALKVLIDLKNKKETPSLIPKIIMEEHQNGIFYKLDDYASNLEKFLKKQQESNGFFTFLEIFSFFNQIINGLTFLEINGFTIKINVSSFFISQNNELRCIDCDHLTKEIRKDSIKNFGILIIHIFTFMDFEKISCLAKSELKKIQMIINEMDRKYSINIGKNDLRDLHVFIKIMKKIFDKSNEEFGYIDLFSEMLKERPLEHLEKIILLTETNCNF